MLQIYRPTLLLDEAICRANIRRMAKKALRSGSRFRPHFKTHQSLMIAEWFRDEGVAAITVSSVKMAEYFSQSWRDITIAMPFNTLEMSRVSNIDEDCSVNLCVMSVRTLEELRAGLAREVGIWIKIDVGYHRTGLDAGDDEIGRIVDWLYSHGQANGLHLQGFLAHAGHSYHAAGTAEVRAIDGAARRILQDLRKRYAGAFPGLEISLGDTPSCSLVDDFSDVDELRPGNLVFYDLTQYTIGACALNDIAVALACPVIACHADKIIVHGGSAHFSKDWFHDDDGAVCYGRVVAQKGRDLSSGWKPAITGLSLTSVSQEHGTITGPGAALRSYRVGDIVLVLPAHSCLTASCMKSYTTLSGQHLDHLEGVAHSPLP